MPLESFLVGFALAAGAASFFSPCSVGLFPAYVGYYLGRGPNFRPIGDGGATETRVLTVDSAWSRLADGIRLGGLSASGFFLLFVVIGLLVSQVGTGFLGPYLRWISIGIGVAILAFGVLMVTGGFPNLAPRIRAPRSRTPTSMLVFGIGYGLASLGCTLPVFLSTLLASLAAGGAWSTFLVMLAYAAGMGLVMVAVTVALSISEGAARAYVRKVVPHIQRASAGLMALAGAVVIYFYAVVWR